MSTQTDVLSVTLTASGSAVAARARVKAIYYVAGATAGSILVKDGGSGGTTQIDLATPAAATATSYMLLPGEGVLFATNVYLTITNATSVVIYYG